MLPFDLHPADEWADDAPDGAYINVPDRAYHSHPSLSRTVIAKYITECPRMAQHKIMSEYEEDDPSLGTMVHDRVLLSDQFQEKYALASEVPGECEGTTSGGSPCSNSPSFRVGNNWYCHHHGDKSQSDDIFRVSSGNEEKVKGMAESVASHDEAHSYLLEAEETELSLLWTEPSGVRVRARLDAVGEQDDDPYIADLKTCSCAHPKDAGRNLAKSESWLQPAVYRRGYTMLGGGITPEEFVFCFVEDREPYIVQCYRMRKEQRLRTQQELGRVLEEIADLPAEQMWPAYAPGVPELEIPHWKVSRIDLPPLDLEQVEDDS